MANLNDPAPNDVAEARRALRLAGHDVDAMNDDQATTALRALLRERIPAPVRSGAPPVNARRWLTEALVAGGFAEPEDRSQRADLDDGGETVHLAVLGVLVMRHISGGKRAGWSTDDLAARIKQPPEDIRRAQVLLDQVASDMGQPAAPAKP